MQHVQPVMWFWARRVPLARLVTGLVFGVVSVHAQTWIPVGPPGGDVRALAPDPRDPNRIYLGTSDGVLYRSDDGGLHWRMMGPPFPLSGCSLDEIAVDQRGVVLVGYWNVRGRGGGVARSADGGQTLAVLKGVDGESVRALAVAPSDPRVIVAGTLSGVFLSRNGGQAWLRITPKNHAGLRYVESLAFDPTDPRIIYVGTRHLSWKTLDGGAKWRPMHRGMIDDSHVMTLTVDHRNPQTVYATACTGIYRSRGGAREWTKLNGIPFSSRRTRAFSEGDDARMLLAGTTEGLWISEDDGNTWRRATSKNLVVNALLVQPGGTIILGTEGAGVLSSSDRGRTWTDSNTGFSNQLVSDLLVDPASRRLFVAVRGDRHYGGVFVSSKVQGPWTSLRKGMEGRRVLSLALMSGTILAGTDEGIFALAPKATRWTRLPVHLDGRELHPRVTDLLALPGGRLLAGTPNGLIRSRDKGRTWRQLLPEETSGLAMSPDDFKLVVASTRRGLFRSNDGGDTWKQASSIMQDMAPHAIAFIPSDDRVLLATTSRGLFRSRDQGATWQLVAGGIPHSDLTGIAVHRSGRTIYVSDFTWGGIFRSVDGGSTWERMPTDGLPSDRVWTLGFDPGMPDRLLAATSAGGLYLMSESVVTGLASGSHSNAAASMAAKPFVGTRMD